MTRADDIDSSKKLPTISLESKPNRKTELSDGQIL